MTVAELQERVRRHRRPHDTDAPPRTLSPVPSSNGPATTPSSGAELREVVSIPLGPAMRLATRVALVSYAMWLAALALFAAVCAVFGLVGRFEDMVRSLGFRGFHLVSGPVLALLGAFGAIWIVTVLVLAMVAVASFNVASVRSHRLQMVLTPRRGVDHS